MTAREPELIRAPWTPEQVEALNLFQRDGLMHPFTCRNRPHPEHWGDVLVATAAGWECPTPDDVCDYTQTWAHAFMADPEVRQRLHRYYDEIFQRDR